MYTATYTGDGTRALVAERIRDARSLHVRLPEAAFFCGTTAALILGIPVPIELAARPALHVGMPSPECASRASGVIGHKLQIDPRDVGTCSGLRVTSVPRTWCDLAAVLDLEDLVAAGDRIIHYKNPLASRANLAAAIDAHPARRGRALLREALELLDERADSPPESVIRVTVVCAGIRGFHANYPVRNIRGEIIAWGDLSFPAHRVAFEYQGDYHRTEPGRWRKDLTRKARMASAGWQVIEIAGTELADRQALLELIRDTLAFYPAVHPVDLNPPTR
ncbi:hypothetical protein [Glaciibacter psychrotolerans]|uniref:DUF559 domain-containing protein n=1 Tax=Glaciibacter psychrotolerans TaxID=670054 RepID=A0A7Z0EFG3_9MICO|nr:hypothetical protein [Leifsonia psychrotolerans]NYJ20651.1 hypothetical protein [Leifsonia psychrotolerans]